jgi:hypothetical protein
VTPAGISEYRDEVKSKRSRLRLDVYVSSVNLPAASVLDIFLDNTFIGQLSIDSSSNGYFRIESGSGQNVPVVSNGMRIEIRQGGSVILAGVFGTVTPTPSPSGSPTGSPSPSASPSPSVSPTASPIGSPSPSPSVSPTASPSPGSGDLFASLSGSLINGVAPVGSAQYEIHSSRREMEIFARQVNLPSGMALSAFVDNVFVGLVIIDGNMEGSLRLRTDNGDIFPFVVSGSTIQLKNGASTILSGTFVMASPSPSPSASPSP